MIHFSAAEIRAALPWPLLLETLQGMFLQGCHIPIRTNLPLHLPQAPDSRFLLMPAWNDEYFGLKVVASLPENRAHARPSLTATYFLFQLQDGHCIASFEGDELTTRRTVATSALAARLLVRPDARKLLILGSGRIASAIPFCFQHVAPFDQVRVWSRNLDQAAILVETCRAAGLPAAVETNRCTGIAWADIISSATPATEPLIPGNVVRPGTHVDLIGSFTPSMHEADLDLITRARLFVDTEAACQESGDLLQAPASTRAAAVTLNQLLGGAPGRTSRDQVTVFKSVGHALQDFVTARLLYTSRQRNKLF